MYQLYIHRYVRILPSQSAKVIEGEELLTPVKGQPTHSPQREADHCS